MRPKERLETGQTDLFKARLDQIVDLSHALVKLARSVDWGFLEKTFGAVYNDGPGQPPLPTRLMAGLAILKHMHDLSDEVLCERWVENPYYQLFCGEEFFQHKLPFDRSSMIVGGSGWEKKSLAHSCKKALRPQPAAVRQSPLTSPKSSLIRPCNRRRSASRPMQS